MSGQSSGASTWPGIEEARLEALLSRFAGLRVAVFGDFYLDKYLEVDPELAEPSLETGRTAHQVVGARHSPGAAGTVVNNLAALMGLAAEAGRSGASGAVLAIGPRGDDGAGYELAADLAAIGVDCGGLYVDRALGRRTPVYLKPRDAGKPGLEGEHNRYDLKNRVPTGADAEAALKRLAGEAAGAVDAFIVMDQVEDEGRGACTPNMYRYLSSLASGRKRPLFWADSRRRIDRFKGFLRKMNQFELLGIVDPAPGESLPDSTVTDSIRTLGDDDGARVFVTAGERGAWVRMPGGEPVLVPAVRIDGPVDPTGAGDSFTAGAMLSLAAGASTPEAALVGILAASVTVRKLGTTGTASPGEMLAALRLWKGQR